MGDTDKVPDALASKPLFLHSSFQLKSKSKTALRCFQPFTACFTRSPRIPRCFFSFSVTIPVVRHAYVAKAAAAVDDDDDSFSLPDSIQFSPASPHSFLYSHIPVRLAWLTSRHHRHRLSIQYSTCVIVRPRLPSHAVSGSQAAEIEIYSGEYQPQLSS